MPQLRVKFLFSQLEDEKCVTQKYRQGEGCFQHNLGFNDTLAELVAPMSPTKVY